MKDVSRREFLKYVGIGALGFAVRPASALTGGTGLFDRPSSDVIECYHVDATRSNVIYPEIVQLMMDSSITTLTGIPDVGEAWKSLFPDITQATVIGIKVNCINRYLSTHPEVAAAIVGGLAQMQVEGSPFPKNNVIVWDRLNSELTSAGYTIYTGSDPDTARCFGTNQSGVGYDSSAPLNVNGSTRLPSKLLSQTCQYVINAACLKDHSIASMTFTLKNHYGSNDNPGALHGTYCNPWIPSLSQQIRDVLTPQDKVRLFIVDGLFGIYSGGPGGQPQFNPELILMSRDTVAVDYHAQSIVNAERQAHSLQPKYAAHITTAAEPPYSLGTTDINVIQLRNVGIAGGVRPVAPTGLRVSPQPFRGRATVSFALARSGATRLELVDAAGRSFTVFSGELDAGPQRLELRPPRRLSAGNYLLRLTGAAPASCPVTILKGN